MKISTIYKLYTVMKKIIAFLTNVWTLVVITSGVTATLDLIRPGLGWILAFLLFFGGVIYIITKKRKT